jgi:hypothetical protein
LWQFISAICIKNFKDEKHPENYFCSFSVLKNRLSSKTAVKEGPKRKYEERQKDRQDIQLSAKLNSLKIGQVLAEQCVKPTRRSR